MGCVGGVFKIFVGASKIWVLPAPIILFLSLSGCFIVEFLVVFEAPGPSNVHVWSSGCRVKQQRVRGPTLRGPTFAQAVWWGGRILAQTEQISKAPLAQVEVV